MIIKKINVKSFGKLKNKEIELKDGLNIIYGENESGKSTLQSFIKVMLYGVCNKRGKKTLSDRAKFTPLGEGSFSGELLVEDNGEEILIDRSFGKTKKYDEGNILNNITGEKINKYSWQEPGKDIFNLSSEGFKNTLFISQMGCIVESSKQDDVLNKIINILECGADEVSYKKIKNNLEENKKSLTNSRKTGKLDLLRIKESELLEERYKRVKIHEENIENELYLKELKEKRTDLNLKIEELELHKKNLKKSELKNEYENINEYLNKKEKLEEELKVLLEELKDVQAICDLKKLNNLRDEKVIMITAHRRENWGEGIENICTALNKIVEDNKDVELVYLVHLNPVVKDVVYKNLDGKERVHLLPPLDTKETHNLMNKCFMVMTDSGGLQEEAPHLGKPVLVLRDVTERPEAVQSGTVKLVGTDVEKILEEANSLINDEKAYAKMSKAINPYGDGKASERIVKAILNYFGKNDEEVEEFISK